MMRWLSTLVKTGATLLHKRWNWNNRGGSILRFSKWIVALVISLNVVFTGIVLYIFWVTQYEPSTLITSWFAFTTGELLALAGIKWREIGRESKEINGNTENSRQI
jgi:hypothetical protein